MQNYTQAALGEAFVRQRRGLPGALECLRDGASRFGFDEDTKQQLEKLLEAGSLRGDLSE